MMSILGINSCNKLKVQNFLSATSSVTSACLFKMTYSCRFFIAGIGKIQTLKIKQVHRIMTQNYAQLVSYKYVMQT